MLVVRFPISLTFPSSVFHVIFCNIGMYIGMVEPNVYAQCLDPFPAKEEDEDNVLHSCVCMFFFSKEKREMFAL